MIAHHWTCQTYASGLFAGHMYEWCFNCGALKVSRYSRIVPVGRKRKDGTRRLTTTDVPTEVYYRVPRKRVEYKREPKCKAKP